MVKISISVDASSLILITKIGLLNELCHTFNIIVSESVYHESTNYSEYNDAKIIKEYINNKRIFVKKVNKRQKFILDLGEGEKQVLELYTQEKAKAVLIDDKKAIKGCKYHKINYITSPYLVYYFYKKKIINKNKAILSLKSLEEFGRYKADIIGFYLLKITDQENA